MTLLIPARGEEYLGSNPGAERAYRFTIGAGSSYDVDVSSFTGTKNIAVVAAGVLVTKMLARITTAFTASTAITIGDQGDVDEFFKSADLGPTSAVTTGIMKNSLEAAEDADYGKEYPSGATLTVSVSAASPTAGAMNLIVFAVPPQS